VSPSTLLLPLIALLAAMALPIQAAINAQLARGVGSPIVAAAISFAAGAAVLAAVAAVLVRDLPPVGAMLKTPLWLFIAGGALGTVYVTSNVVLAPKLGAATLFSFAIAGQLLAALAMDQFGLLGLAVRELSVGRIAGAGLVLVGALMVRLL
jgi:bacterial/archaeal transporter family-2 protein